MLRPRFFILLAASTVALASCGSGSASRSDAATDDAGRFGDSRAAGGAAGRGAGGTSGQLGQATDLGKPCLIAVATSPAVLTLDTASAACESHLCLSPADTGIGRQTTLCSALCASDDDCANGIRGTGNEADGVPRCRLGFRCRTLIPPLEGNPASCTPLCVCADSFLDPNEVALKPPGC